MISQAITYLIGLWSIACLLGYLFFDIEIYYLWAPGYILLGILGGINATQSNKKIQKNLNSNAQNKLKDIKSDKIGSFALLLRPFALDTILQQKIKWNIFMGFALADRNYLAKLNPEVELQSHLQKYLDMDLILAKNTFESKLQEGGGSVHLDKNAWKNKIEILIQEADVIIYIPGLTPSCVYEENYINSHPEILDKTIVLIPKLNSDWPDSMKSVWLKNLQEIESNLKQNLSTNETVEQKHNHHKQGAGILYRMKDPENIKWGSETSSDVLMVHELQKMISEITKK